MRVLIACEFSGTVRDAFLRRGHDAMSCDLLPTEVPGPHYQGDALSILNDGWDLMIAHPPCTYLCSSGLHWNKRIEGREAKTAEAVEFVRALLNAPIARIALENPIGRIGTAIRKADQIIQPHQFGEDASKATALWLKNLPPLSPTSAIPPRIVNGKERWGNQCDSGQNKLGPSPDRWAERSKTYPGIAEAMAAQWGGLGLYAPQTASNANAAASLGANNAKITTPNVSVPDRRKMTCTNTANKAACCTPDLFGNAIS